MNPQPTAGAGPPPVRARPPAERRRAARQAFPLARLARLTLHDKGHHLAAWVVDLSATGVGLLLSSPLEPCTAVTVRLHGASHRITHEFSARVVQVTPEGAGRHLVGCELDRPLEPHELKDLLTGGAAVERVPRFLPMSLACLRGYSGRQLGADLVAGLVVGVVALPLAMAFAIGSGVPPERGLFTAIVAGFLISALGGSRVQIGGPTGAFVVIVFGVIAKHGYDGLVLATVMAGVILVVMGLSGLGAAVKFIPSPVTIGFTAGIGVVIASLQVNDLLGLGLKDAPPEFFAKWGAYFQNLGAVHGPTAGLSLFCLAVLIFWPRVTRRVPAPLVAMLAASVLAYLFLPGVETIGTRFGGIPRMLPAPRLPAVSWHRIQELVNPAVVIALLAAVESLLSAVVADGMTGYRHNSNTELVAQGLANIAAPLFGGISATGAIARTATNIKTGGRTPVAGMAHAVTLLLIMLLLAPLAVHIPLCALAAVLVVVSWNMAEVHTFAALLRGPRPDVAVLLVTFGLTVVFDLTVGVEVGMVLAGFLFIKRMADVSAVQAVSREAAEGGRPREAAAEAAGARAVPAGVEVYEVNGPFFFGMADKVKDVLRTVAGVPRVFILRMRNVPAMDATGLRALLDLRHKCRREGCTLVLSEIHAQPFLVLDRSGYREEFGAENVTADFDDALDRADRLLGQGA